MADREWTLQLNVAGEQYYKPGTIDRVPDGPYEVVISDSWREPSSGKNEDGSAKSDNIVFECTVAKGPEKGKKLRRYKSAVEGDAGSAGRKEWKNLLASIVKDPATLETGAKTLKASAFAGKTAFILVTNPPEGAKDPKSGKAAYANINFITKDMVAEFTKTAASRGASSANGASAPTAGGKKEFEVVGGGASAPQPPEADPLE